MKPFFSIVVSVFNVENYIVQCVESILGQSFDNFELILVDDGSTDNSGQLCDDLAAKNAKAIVIHQKNGGLSEARNSGLKVAKGNFVWFVDGDDWIEKDALLTIEKYITENDLEVFAFSHVNFFEDTGKYSHVSNPQDIPVMTGLKYIEISERFFTSACLHIYKRQWLSDNDCAFKPNQIHEDDYFNLSYFGKIQRIMKISQPLYFYTRRNESLTTNRSKNVLEKRMASYINLINLTNAVNDLNVDFLKRKNAEYKQILFGILLDYFHTDISNSEKKSAIQSIKKAKIHFPLSKSDLQQSKKMSFNKWLFNFSGHLFHKLA
ncbi:MAG TPA: glycosyltransferase [Flavobacterium sp.]|nr:glycosyltransferase [Flavobacterium sp.]